MRKLVATPNLSRAYPRITGTDPIAPKSHSIRRLRNDDDSDDDIRRFQIRHHRKSASDRRRSPPNPPSFWGSRPACLQPRPCPVSRPVFGSPATTATATPAATAAATTSATTNFFGFDSPARAFASRPSRHIVQRSPTTSAAFSL